MPPVEPFVWERMFNTRMILMGAIVSGGVIFIGGYSN